MHESIPPHPNIVPLLDAIWERACILLVMPAQPVDLHDIIDAAASSGFLPEGVVMAVAHMLLSGLAHLHSLGVAHRVRRLPAAEAARAGASQQ